MTSIALIDDHPMLTNTLGAWLEATGRISVAGTARNLSEARTLMERLELSIRTVENHLAHIYSKLNIKSREELIRL